jgi:type IV secretory pathway TrbD component
MQNREFDRWARIREQGVLRYVLLKGLLCYGVPMFVLMTYVIPHPRLTAPQSALLWAFTGAGYGLAMWMVQERRFRKVAGRA